MGDLTPLLTDRSMRNQFRALLISAIVPLGICLSFNARASVKTQTTALQLASVTGPILSAPKNISPPWVPQVRSGSLAASWLQRHQHNLAIATAGGVDVLFLGDSITDYWTTVGKLVWNREYAPLHAADFGIGGDTTQNVLWRIENGELNGLSPKVVVLAIGTNNLHQAEPDEIAKGVWAIASNIHAQLPNAKILLLGIFPRGFNAANPLREQVRETNALLAQLADGSTVQYLDIGANFLAPDGSILRSVMKDSVHPTRVGYQIWADAMRSTLDAMLGSAQTTAPQQNATAKDSSTAP